MKVRIVMDSGPYLLMPVLADVEWPLAVLPRAGEMFGPTTLLNLIDWDTIEENEVTDNLQEDGLEFKTIYEYCRKEGFDHAQSMRRVMDTYLGDMCYVETVLWREEDGEVFPEIWLTNKEKETLVADAVCTQLNDTESGSQYSCGKREKRRCLSVTETVVVLLFMLVIGACFYFYLNFKP